ncbi:MAG: sodium:proton antiporter [Microbacteriaceae bacterium]|jgi:multicomponent Na+:H+ antiporter subunit F|nr:sodium:proton antiporter [Microbacteriaceae bacterium]
MDLIYLGVGALFTAAALLTVYRIVRGPSILDRMIASDVLLTTLMLTVGAEMVYNGHTRTIPLMVVLASTAVFATIAVARYVSKQDISGLASPDTPVADSPLGGSAAATSSPPADGPLVEFTDPTTDEHNQGGRT